MNAFKAYDIRGVYNKDWNKEDAYKIGFFLPELLNADKILVGRDVRLSSDEIFLSLSRGITDAGADVYDAGLATTPMIYWATGFYDYPASVQITASHNPKEYNGLKISRKNVIPVGYDSGLRELETIMKSRKVKTLDNKGKVIQKDIRQDYLQFLNTYQSDFGNLNLAIDCSNGMAALIVKEVLGKNHYYIYDKMDGHFPNHEANPLVPANIVDLQQLVKSKDCDLGIIFDGDADRVMFVDENARFISPDLMIAVLGDYFLPYNNNRVLQDIRTSKAVGEYLGKKGAEMHTWRVGRAYAAKKLREIDGLFGGELAGHYYFKDFYYSDSAFLATLIILKVLSNLKQKGISFSELIKQIYPYYSSGEKNYKICRKAEAMEAVKDFFMREQKPEKFLDFDGYRLEYDNFWISIRPSNTEPYLRFIAEAKSQALLEQTINKVEKIILEVERE